MNSKAVIFGDSILRGIILNDEMKYRISSDINYEKIEKELDIKIINYAKMGCTITKGKKVIDSVLEKEPNIKYALIEYGGNDCDYDWSAVAEVASKAYLPKTPVEDFEQNLIAIIEALKSRGIKPILMTLPPINADKYFKWICRNITSVSNVMYFLGDVDIIYRRQELYSNVIASIGYRMGVDVVDIRNEFLIRNDFPELLCEDGIHLNDKGRDVMIQSFIRKYKK